MPVRAVHIISPAAENRLVSSTFGPPMALIQRSPTCERCSTDAVNRANTPLAVPYALTTSMPSTTSTAPAAIPAWACSQSAMFDRNPEFIRGTATASAPTIQTSRTRVSTQSVASRYTSATTGATTAAVTSA